MQFDMAQYRPWMTDVAGWSTTVDDDDSYDLNETSHALLVVRSVVVVVDDDDNFDTPEQSKHPHHRHIP